MFAPFGARGLNSGVADAVVSASAIDAALRAPSRDDAMRIIQEAADSRHAAATRNRAASSTALAHLEAGSWWRRGARAAAAQLAARIPAAGRWLDKAPFGPPLGAADRDGMYY